MGDSSSNTEQHGELEVNDTGKMLLLDYQNNLIETQLKERLSKDAAHSFIDQTVSDFDGVTFHISTPESKTQILLSIQIRCFRELVQYGAEQVLQREYGDFVTATEPGYDFSVLIDLTTLPDMSDEERDALALKFALLKRNAMAAPFEQAYQEYYQLKEEASKYTSEEAIYIKASHDRVAVIFSTIFREETDRVFGKV